MPAAATASRPYIRQRSTGPFWYGKWSRDGKSVVRSLGRAWAEPDGAGGWKLKRGRAKGGALTEPQAAARMLELIADHDAQQAALEQSAEERRRRGITFRELAIEWLDYLEQEKQAKPSTLANYRWMLAEPGEPHRRGRGRTPGLLLESLGDRPAREITSRDVSQFLRRLGDDGKSTWTINKYRQVICAAFNFGMREDTFGLERNPAATTNKRREPPPAVLDFYEPDEVEAIAQAAARGAHRWVEWFTRELDATRDVMAAARAGHVPLARVAAEVESNPAFAAKVDSVPDARAQLSGSTEDPGRTADALAGELRARRLEDVQDAALYRIAAYTGLRLGELLALRWGDVDLSVRRLVVHRAFSARIEGPTKTWQARFVPIADPAAAAFAALLTRDEFVSPEDFVFCSRLGRPLDPGALRRRFKRTAAAIGLRVLKFHALRHGAGSLIARQADPRWVQGFLGHSKLSTTERYLHAKARPEDVAVLNRAFATLAPDQRAPLR
ncbi:MAG TPA: tyrosine-type recombinase/integrase [Solirubrobacteraceae bacterium]|nr:tyrosine-type recombinase/integrase [Solirubrobacteraceae bacterium]